MGRQGHLFRPFNFYPLTLELRPQPPPPVAKIKVAVTLCSLVQQIAARALLEQIAEQVIGHYFYRPVAAER